MCDGGLIKIPGVDYSPEGIQRLRGELIDHRDKLLERGGWPEGAMLTHAIILLDYLAHVESAS